MDDILPADSFENNFIPVEIAFASGNYKVIPSGSAGANSYNNYNLVVLPNPIDVWNYNTLQNLMATLTYGSSPAKFTANSQLTLRLYLEDK